MTAAKKYAAIAAPAAVLCSCLWNGLYMADVFKEAGETWLAAGFAMLSAVLFLAAFAFAVNIKRGGLFIPMAFLLGTGYLFVMPPLSAPDEISHFISAYELSSRLMSESSRDQEGHVLLDADDAWVDDLDGTFFYDTENGILKMSRDTDGEESVLSSSPGHAEYVLLHDADARAALCGRFDNMDAKKAASVHPPVNTTPAAYFFPALMLAAGRRSGADTFGLFFLGRAANLVFFICMSYAAQRMAPFAKEIFAAVAFLPMSMQLAASFSYDVFAMGCMFFFSAFCLRACMSGEKLPAWQWALSVIVLAAFAPCKVIYSVFAGLYLAIPAAAYGGKWKKAVFILAALCLTAAAVYAANIVTVSVMASSDPENAYVAWAGAQGYSLSYLLHRPVETARIFINTFLLQSGEYAEGMIGRNLGASDPVLDISFPVLAAFFILLLMSAQKRAGDKTSPVRLRFLILVLCAGCACACLLSMLLAWTPMGSTVVLGVQGRYFLPFLPLLLYACRDFLPCAQDRGERLLLAAFALDACVLISMFTIISRRF